MAPDPAAAGRVLAAQTPRLIISQWATGLAVDGREVLSVDTHRRRVAMSGSHATGEPLVSNGLLGADIIRLAAGEGFAPHTHPGDHLLLILAGEGTITYDGQVIPTRAGDILMVDGGVPHAVGAITDHVILAVGSPHRPVDAPDRMAPVEYCAVTVDIGRLHCLICNVEASHTRYLHDWGCPHCPCSHCNPVVGR